MRNWERAEVKVPKKIGGKRSPGSGNGYWEGDIRNSTFLIEMKETGRKFMTISIPWFFKISDEASRSRKSPVLGIEFNDGSQIFFVKSKMVELINKKSLDWLNSTSVRVYPGDLEEGDKVITKYGLWVLITIETLRDLSEEQLHE